MMAELTGIVVATSLPYRPINPLVFMTLMGHVALREATPVELFHPNLHIGIDSICILRVVVGFFSSESVKVDW
jgi:hypothetical protein